MSAPSPANPSGKLQQALAIQRRREARRLLWMGILLLVLLGTVLADKNDIYRWFFVGG